VNSEKSTSYCPFNCFESRLRVLQKLETSLKSNNMDGIALTSHLSNRELEDQFIENHRQGSQLDKEWLTKNEAILAVAQEYGLDPSISIVKAFLTDVLIALQLNQNEVGR